MLSRTKPDGTAVNYTYTAAGQVETIITPAQTIPYTYDDFDRLDEVTANGETTQYDYDIVGNLIQTTLPNGVVETRTYDQLNRLIDHIKEQIDKIYQRGGTSNQAKTPLRTYQWGKKDKNADQPTTTPGGGHYRLDLDILRESNLQRHS